MTDDEKAMLDLAGQRFNYAGNLEQQVWDEFGISLTRYFQIVNRLLDTQEALRYSPQVVNRLRRLRTRRTS
ncbi:helix-turn-helix DNA-binding protein [Gordonia phage Squiddly]|nr:helix-turn-helix DNA-binding protein [Gordonia phage Squiddly]